MKNILLFKLRIFVSSVLILACLSSVGQTGLVAYYPFNGNANDESGNGNHGTVNGATLTNDRFGNQNSAYYFDGYNDEIIINATSSLLNFTADNHSYSVWINLESNPSVPKFVVDGSATGPGGDQRGIRFHSSNYPTFKWVTDNASYTVTSSMQVYSGNDWYHIVGVFNGSEGKIYVNAQEKGTTLSSGTPTPIEVLKIGNVSAGGTGNGFSHGKIDDIRLFDCALTLEEIIVLYNETPTSIEVIPSEISKIIVFPNPANSKLSIKSNNLVLKNIEIVNLLGEKIYMSDFTDVIDVSGFSKGIYLIIFKDKEGNILNTEKVIIK